MRQMLTNTVGKRKVETKGQIFDTKDNGEVAERGTALIEGGSSEVFSEEVSLGRNLER